MTGTPDERMLTLVHDLRTPLTVVAGFADLLEARGEELSVAERLEYTKRLADGARELCRILDAERAERPPPAA